MQVRQAMYKHVNAAAACIAPVTLLPDDFHRYFPSSVQMSSGNPLTENQYSSG
jgi:hypothetical protein